MWYILERTLTDGAWGATSALRGIDISERLLRRLELRCAEAIMDSERAPERMDALLEPAR